MNNTKPPVYTFLASVRGLNNTNRLIFVKHGRNFILLKPRHFGALAPARRYANNTQRGAQFMKLFIYHIFQLSCYFLCYISEYMPQYHSLNYPQLSSELLGFGTLSIVRYCKELENTVFRKMDFFFYPQVRGDTYCVRTFRKNKSHLRTETDPVSETLSSLVF
jgi:hypothetical protein